MNRQRIWTTTVAALTVIGILTAGIAGAVTNDKSTAWVKACADRRTGELRLARQGCRASEAKVNWARRGPAGPPGRVGSPGQPGPAGALSTTPVHVQLEAIRPAQHELSGVGGVEIELACDPTHLGAASALLTVVADEIHGSSTSTLYNDRLVMHAETYAIDGRVLARLNGASPRPDYTHATENATLVVTVDGVVSQVTMYVSRDNRQGRPACEFIGSITELGPATVTPS